MTDDHAWKWLGFGLAMIFAGLVLLHLDDLLLSTMWGTGLVLSGSAIALVGTGALLRLWR